MCRRFTAILTLVLLCSTTSAQILHVDDDAPGGGDGLSWKSPLQYLQDALAAAREPGSGIEEIRVAGGSYRPDQGKDQVELDPNASFEIVSGVALKGGFAGFGAPDPDARDIDEYETVLTGDLEGDDKPDFTGYSENSRHVLTAIAPAEGTVLDGLTVRSGNAIIWPDHDQGAGLWCTGGALDILDCLFTRNQANVGGGALLENCVSSIIGSTFHGNLVLTSSGRGGGLALDGGTADIADSFFLVNDAQVEDGGGIHSSAVLTLLDCHFIENRGTDDGGGAVFEEETLCVDCSFIDNGSFYAPVIGLDTVYIGCDFISNNAGGSTGAVRGGECFVDCRFIDNRGSNTGALSTQGTVIDCLFAGNAAFIGGSGAATLSNSLIANTVFVGNTALWGAAAVRSGTSGTCEFVNCTFTENLSGDASGAAVLGRGTFANCIFWDDGPAELDGEITLSYSCVEGGWPGEGNIDADPLFRDPPGPDGVIGTLDDNLRLSAGSPCIDAGDNLAVPMDLKDLDGDGDVKEPIPFDLDGRPRFIDDPSTVDTGNPDGIHPIVDMGAYEFDPASPMPGDIDGDGDVDFVDLMHLLSDWGPCADPPADCPADLNGNGSVDFTDLLILLSHWG